MNLYTGPRKEPYMLPSIDSNFWKVVFSYVVRFFFPELNFSLIWGRCKNLQIIYRVVQNYSRSFPSVGGDCWRWISVCITRYVTKLNRLQFLRSAFTFLNGDVPLMYSANVGKLFHKLYLTYDFPFLFMSAQLSGFMHVRLRI